MNELSQIQHELKAPKGQFNNFGNYKYRSAEDILEAVKPLLFNYACHLTITDDIQLIGDRYYIKATATITSKDGSQSVTAFAREEETKKGMDGAQITGAASSYARKYALNGLFCIDDTKDPDATNDHGKKEPAREDDDLIIAIDEVGQCDNVDQLQLTWKTWAAFQTNSKFIAVVNNRKKQLTDGKK
jgi:hypothetical protein